MTNGVSWRDGQTLSEACRCKSAHKHSNYYARVTLAIVHSASKAVRSDANYRLTQTRTMKIRICIVVWITDCDSGRLLSIACACVYPITHIRLR